MKMVLHLSMHTGMHLLVCPGSQERPGNQPSAHMQERRARGGGGLGQSTEAGLGAEQGAGGGS